MTDVDQAGGRTGGVAAARPPVPGRIPDCALRVRRDGHWQAVRSTALFAGRRVVVFALPGAFTPTCSSQHLPRYEELAPLMRRHGVDAVFCVSVNDPFVMDEWGRNQGVREVQLLSDGNGEFTSAMGMLLDARALGLGRRSRRYSMLVRDGVVERLFAERDADGDPYEVSDADTMLGCLAPQAPRPPRIVVFAKPGCPYCAAARRALDGAGLRYENIELPDAKRARVLGALGVRPTAPQVFADGERIGGSEELAGWLRRRGPEPGTDA
ncbi:glutathione peroxidase [Solimonas soli]|uniref:glutathione peroxidase n=1 Tax=Solimonas soli TaxID=413479 RepID=UPI0009FD2650|nr:glutathione peroxidase [Solimonas soli]